MSSESNSGSGGQNLSNDDFDVMVDMGYGRKIGASQISGAVEFSGAKVQLSESGEARFLEAAIKDTAIMSSKSDINTGVDVKNATLQEIKPAPDPNLMNPKYGVKGKGWKEIDGRKTIVNKKGEILQWDSKKVK